MKYLLVLIIIISTFGNAGSSVTMICTPHLNELVNYGVPRSYIFQRGDNYCAAIGDNSAQIVKDGITWLLNQITGAFVTVQDDLDNITEEEFNENFNYKFDEESNKANGKQSFEFKAARGESTWLDDFIRFWHLDNLWGIDKSM